MTEEACCKATEGQCGGGSGGRPDGYLCASSDAHFSGQQLERDGFLIRIQVGVCFLGHFRC